MADDFRSTIRDPVCPNNFGRRSSPRLTTNTIPGGRGIALALGGWSPPPAGGPTVEVSRRAFPWRVTSWCGCRLGGALR